MPGDDLPTRLFRVVFDEGYGFPPPPYKRVRKQRTYADAQRAADMVASLARWPHHHRLVGVWTTKADWQPVDLDQLPPPREQTWRDE